MKVVVSHDHQFAFEGEPLPLVPGHKLIAKRYAGRVSSQDSGYDGLIRECSEASKNIRSQLEQAGYATYLFLIGAKIQNRDQRYPMYDLAGSAKRQGILEGACIKQDYKSGDFIQSIGIYKIDKKKFYQTCIYASQHSLSLILMTKRNVLTSNELDQVYNEAISEGITGRLGVPSTVSWRGISVKLCPKGDVIVPVFGRFDDRDRAIVYIGQFQTKGTGEKGTGAPSVP